MQPGSLVADRYVIEAVAGSGGMSTVYRARDRGGELVAIKVLKLQAAHQAARFLRETNLLYTLRHPSIVSYLDSGRMEESGQYFLVLEWLDGQDLHSYLEQRRLDVRESLALAERIADALGFAHARGVVHRDVKPENIFLPGGLLSQAKLLDFGIARWAEAVDSLTRTGARFGTPAYMSPEQVRGDRDLDVRADVFSLGCVLYECVAGEPAFAATDPMAVFGKILFDDPPRVSALVPNVPKALETLLERMMAREPSERPISGDALAVELRELQQLLERAPARRRGRNAFRRNTLTDLEQRLVSVVVATVDSAAHEAALLLSDRDGEGDPEDTEDNEVHQDSADNQNREGPGHRASGTDADDGDISAPSGNIDTQADTQAGTGVDEILPGLALPSALDAAVRAELEPLGARVGLLQSGLLVAVLEHRVSSMHRTAADQAAQAARAALSLRRSVPDAPMALATGRAVVQQRRLIGEVIDRAVSLLGQSVDDAESAREGGDAPGPEDAPGREIRIDEVTAGLLGGRFAVTRSEGGALYLGAPPSAGAAPATARSSPFVGRISEVATLTATLDECLEEHIARGLLVTGPAGFGKSRLLREFMERVRGRGVLEGGDDAVEVWIAQGDPMRAGSPLHLFSDALRRTVAIADSEPPARRREKLRRYVGRQLADEHQHRVATFLCELLRIGESDDGGDVQLRAARNDALLMGDQVRRACGDLLDAETRQRPLLFVIEDLHWGDRATIDVLDLAMRNLSERPFLVLALGRPEVHDLFPTLWDGHNLTEIRLSRLSRRAAQKLVRAGLGDDADDARVADLIERGDGNPFYLEELVRRVSAGHVTLPDTVMAMVQGRLSALDSQARRVLRAASVFGGTFWSGGVAALVGDDTPVVRWLETLLELGIISATSGARFAGEQEYEFRHALIGEVAYDMLTEEDKRLGHTLAGRWLMAHGEQDARLLAEHFERGGEPAEALPHYLRAASDALDRSDFDAAVTAAERGIACGAEGTALGGLRRVLMEERVWRGNPTEVIAQGEDALRHLERGSRAWFDVAGELATAYGKREDMVLVEHVAEIIEGEASEVGHAPGRHIALSKVAQVMFACGQRAGAERLLALLESEVGALAQVDLVVAANVHFARAFQANTALADPAAVLLETERCATAFEAIGDARQACLHRTNVGYAKLELGLFAEAEADLRAVLATAERMAIDLVANTARQNLALACAHQGATDEARRLARQACAWFEGREDAPRELAQAHLYLAVVLLLAGDASGAADEIRTSLEQLSEAAPLRGYALAVHARLALMHRAVGDALVAAEEAHRLLAAQSSVESGEATIRLVLVEALAAAGYEDRAHHALAEARRALLDRADKISRPDWRQSFLENIPDHVRTLAAV
ncbi:serine/threonine-protein kinase PknK [Haliangium ochraceum]|uniref:Serine/threonine protein kinase n=1 Tax=Haliangium ochraceum (strain DSM 14365 / JCM 11303 / SMP-2) TaxID=502025 RepID=D0LFX8_HALO1|nr:serine/threonine-protein kinase [Haliangium ochraceum]ACY14580.1 serine/threonine protein kinase [Haliangium ochraceum DSM 14365]